MAVTWADVSALAEELSEQGHTVTQLHHTGEAPDAWGYFSVGAHVVGYADADAVITSDGVRHAVGVEVDE